MAFIYLWHLIFFFDFHLRWSRSFIKLSFEFINLFLITWISLINFSNPLLFLCNYFIFFAYILISILLRKLWIFFAELFCLLFIYEKFLNITIVNYSKSSKFIAIHFFYFKSFVCRSIKFSHFLFSCLFLKSCRCRHIIEKIHCLHDNNDSQKEKEECTEYNYDSDSNIV